MTWSNTEIAPFSQGSISSLGDAFYEFLVPWAFPHPKSQHYVLWHLSQLPYMFQCLQAGKHNSLYFGLNAARSSCLVPGRETPSKPTAANATPKHVVSWKKKKKDF